MIEKAVLKALTENYPQLYLNPDSTSQETYRRIVLRGEEPESKNLDFYSGDEHDCDETMNTPAGEVRVVTLGSRRDFELVMRSLMAAKDGPEAKIPASQGASMVTLFNWPRIHAHLAKFPAEEQDAEFRRFTSVRSNFTDMLVVLSRGPYSGISAKAVGKTEDRWLEESDTIRRYHELTHVICRRLYPDDIDALRDELIADAVGLYAAYGHFDLGMEKLFLGLKDGRYTGGRLENYTDDPDQLAGPITQALERMKKTVDENNETEPFGLIPILMEK